MEETKLTEIMELEKKSLEELKVKYQEVFGQAPTSNNKGFLWRKIAYRIQERVYGGLSAETQTCITELIERYDPVNNKTLRPEGNAPRKDFTSYDRRLPVPGTVITKEYKGKNFAVKVLAKGFEFNGKVYKSLTAIAKEVTGAHWNGYLFFKL